MNGTVRKTLVGLLTLGVGLVILGGVLGPAQPRPLPAADVAVGPAAESGEELEAAGDDKEQARYRAYARSHSGDAERGRRLFTGNRLSCLSYHGPIGGHGDVGPDLIDVGRKHSRAYLITAVLRPSAALAPGYGTVSLSLHDGTVVEGKFVKESAEAVVYTDDRGQTHAVLRKDIRGRRYKSPMPNGLIGYLSLADFSDLVAFLSTLQGAVPEPRDGAGGSQPAGSGEAGLRAGG
jgi:putative heme-binding domain-containing protein